jgi:CDP-diacylglycerol--glycerol-3-phosphate 3-phosphatidyltransferase
VVWQNALAVLYWGKDQKQDLNMANTITLTRLPLLVAVVLLLYLGSPWVQVATAGIVLVLIFMDTLDGMVARRRKEVGMLGSKLDIAVDRVVELVLWVTYANLSLISVAIPIIVIMRGTLVDAIRSFSVVWGKTPFGMMQTKWGQRLVASNFMRSLYGISKAVAFCTLALALGLRRLWAGTPRAGTAEGIWIFAVVASWVATALCIIRGAPVLLEARSLLKDLDTRMAHQETGQ